MMGLFLFFNATILFNRKDSCTVCGSYRFKR